MFYVSFGRPIMFLQDIEFPPSPFSTIRQDQIMMYALIVLNFAAWQMNISLWKKFRIGIFNILDQVLFFWPDCSSSSVCNNNFVLGFRHYKNITKWIFVTYQITVVWDGFRIFNMKNSVTYTIGWYNFNFVNFFQNGCNFFN